MKRILGRSGKMVPISGFNTVKQVEENCRAMEFGPLMSEQLVEIDRIFGR